MSLADLARGLFDEVRDFPLLQHIAQAHSRAQQAGVQLHMTAELRASEHHRPMETLTDLELHPSALSKESECARYHVLAFLFPERQRAVPSKTQVKFDHGTAIHAMWQALFRWAGLTHEMGTHDNEVTLVVDDLFVRARTDGVLRSLDGDARSALLEIKSMESSRFKVLRGPEPDHVKQAQMYLWLWDTLLQRGAEPMQTVGPVDHAVLMYHDKNDAFQDAGTGLPLKVYTVVRAPALIEEIRRTIETAARAWTRALAAPGEQLPERVCPSSTTVKAQRCSQCSNCFSYERFSDVDRFCAIFRVKETRT